MQVHITDLNGHQLVLRRSPAIIRGMTILITLNDGSDPTEIQLEFDQETLETLGKAIDILS